MTMIYAIQAELLSTWFGFGKLSHWGFDLAVCTNAKVCRYWKGLDPIMFVVKDECWGKVVHGNGPSINPIQTL